MKWTEKIQVYNRDCMELLAETPDGFYDLAIVDPPYGQQSDALQKDKDNSVKKRAKRTKYHQFENIMPRVQYFKELDRVTKNWIVWGGNFFGLSGGVIAWNKFGTAFGEGEVAICSTHKSVRFFDFAWNGMIQQDMKNKETRIHPTQKPVKLYEWLLMNYAKPNDKILDTHFGSGSIAIACHNLGFELTACELDKEYYDLAHDRFKKITSQQKLF